MKYLIPILVSAWSVTSAAVVFPLKSLVCEANLSPRMERLSEPDGKEAVVRIAALRLTDRLPKRTIDAGTSYEATAFAGRASHVGGAKALVLRARLNGLHSDLLDSNLDAQKVVFVFRGANYRRAVEHFAKDVEDLNVAYRAQILDVNPAGPRRLGYVLRGAYLLMLANLGEGLVNATQSDYPGLWQSYAMYLMAFGSLGTLSAMVEVPRRDLRHVPLLRALRQIGQGTDRDRMVVRGYAADFDADFVSHVLDPRDSSGREAQLAEDGPGFVAKVAGDVRGGLGWRDARRVFVDHVAYVDQRTGEPVWAIGFRSFRVHPTPRKPSKTTVERAASDWGLLPGASR